MAIHELGHILSAKLNKGTIEHVELRPWTISHTMISGSNNPVMDAWLGPITGITIPVLAWIALHKTNFKTPLLFFAGFCLIANGIYLGLGWIGPHGDCKTIIDNGGQTWPMIIFGLISSVAGFTSWHVLSQTPNNGLQKTGAPSDAI